MKTLLRRSSTVVAVLFLLFLPTLAHAADAIDKADTTWMLISTALVLLMVPGLAFFYGGMVRSKNVLSTIMHSLVAMGLITIQWVVVGYTLAFGPDVGHVVGNLQHLFLNGVGMEPKGSIPALLFMAYQGMFAIITPALISGAVAERMKFSTYCVFMLVWATVIYDPIAHWVWGPGGWLGAIGALDFAGGTVVHLSSGISALVAAMVVGRRLGHPTEQMLPNNLGFTVLGAGLLWFGWFGFNAGSALSTGTLATLAFVNTFIAPGAAAISWMLLEWYHSRTPSTLGVASGIVAGLVVITPAAGFVTPMGALVMGLIGGAVCYLGVLLKRVGGYDDSLDAFGVHGIGGATGALLTGVFASTVFNPGGTAGLLEGNVAALWPQVAGVVATALYAGVGTFVIVKVLGWTMGLRVPDEDERMGLDITQHGEQAYRLH
ncbi:MAG TPA: ammonium transporter [bacterium]|nr:ammonium transporter [bacterium]